MHEMKILISINHMVNYGGSEKYVLALVEGFISLGHSVFLLAIKKGKSFDHAISKGARAYDHQQVDFILLNHNSTFKHIGARNKRTPVFQICHGKFPHLEQPISNLEGYFAISPEVQHFLKRGRIESTLLWNPVIVREYNPDNIRDIDFLVLCQGSEAVDYIRNVLGNDHICIFGNKHSNEIHRVDLLMKRAKVVIGTGRALIEAAVSGCAAFGFDSRHYDGVKFIGPVTPNNWHSLSFSNFSGRGLHENLDMNECGNLLLQTMNNWEKYSSDIQPLGAKQHDYIRVTTRLLSAIHVNKSIFKLFKQNRILDLRSLDEKLMWENKHN